MVRSDRPEVVSAGSPELIGDFLRRESWPPQRYEITSTETPFGGIRLRWGVAIKHPDGSVELIPDPPA
jgi:hypothetical protein